MLKVLKILIFIFLSSRVQAITIAETEFIGNKEVSNKELYRVLSFQNGDDFDYEIANQSISRIYDLYRSEGYRFVEIKPLEALPIDVNRVKIIITIQESPLNYIANMTFTGNYAIKDLIFSELISNSDFNTDDIPKIKQLILDQYALRGYFFTEVNIDKMIQTDVGAEINFLINENKPFNHNYFLFRGNRVSKDFSLIKISRLDRRSTLTPSLLAQARTRLLAKSYITECSINPLDYETLLIDVKEGKMTTISGIVGYNSKNEDYPFNGFLDFAFKNLFGSDRALGFRWNKLQENRTDLALSYHDSGLRNYYFSADIEVKRTEYDTLATLSELYLALNYDFINQDIGLYSRYTKYDILASTSLEEPEEINAIGVFWHQNYFDHLNNPRSGYQARISIDYNMSSLDDSNYNITKASFAYAHSFNNNFVLFNKLNTNYSTKKNLSSYNDFKLGGFSSLRGFQEEQFSGYLTAWSNSELRYLFGQDNNLFFFADTGYLENSKADIITKQGHLYSTGLGMRIATRLGNLTFEYGLGYNDGWNSLYDGLIHFGVETSF
ncbi:BamA/TamA family outer membrane protein [bacterium]|nr:BamA/TamA family outer membrane protein [bacterium]